MDRKPVTIEDIKRACELLKAEGPEPYMRLCPPQPVAHFTWHWWMSEGDLVEFKSPATGVPHYTGHPATISSFLLRAMGSKMALDCLPQMLHDKIQDRTRELFAPIEQAFQDWEYKIYKDETPF